MYNPTYLSEVDLSEETLAHYGVKGMRWGRRKKRKNSSATLTDKRLSSETRRNITKNRRMEGMASNFSKYGWNSTNHPTYIGKANAVGRDNLGNLEYRTTGGAEIRLMGDKKLGRRYKYSRSKK